MDKVSVFESSDFGELRIVVDPKGDVWFVASDVAKSLGYINAKDAVKRHVDDEDSTLLQVSDNQWGVNQSLLKTRYIDNIRIINESGLYSLILSSKLESAKRFKRWITSEVLPSIRKTGEYKTSSGGKGILVPDFSNPADAARAWADQYEAAQKAIAEKSQAEAERQQALKTIEEHKPDVEFAESFRKVDHNNMWLIRDIAKKLEQNGVIIAEKMACRARLPRRKNKLEGSDLRSRPRSFRWCGSHSKKYDSRIPVFPVWKKRNKNIIPVGGQ